MELNHNNQSMMLSLSEIKNNKGKSKIWEVAKQSQSKSANRLHLDGKNNTSKDIIENFTKGLDRETLQNKQNSKTIINNKQKEQNHPKYLNNEIVKNKSNLDQNSNQHITSNPQKRLNNTQLVGMKNLKTKNLTNTTYQKIGKSINKNSENSFALYENNQKKKSNNKVSINLSKKEAKILEMGHIRIVHEIENRCSNKNNNKQNSDDFEPIKENNHVLDSNLKFDEKIENSKIQIDYNENGELNTENENFGNDFKESLLHLLNHFNTEIKGKVNGNHIGEFEIKTNEGNFYIQIKRENNHIEININSDLIYQLDGQLQDIENSILEKMPEIDSIRINITHLNVNYNLKNFNQIDNNKTKLKQDSIFMLNFLA